MGGEVERAARRHRGDGGGVEADFFKLLFFLSGLEDPHRVFFGSGVDLAVGNHRRSAPASGFQVVLPVEFAGAGVEAAEPAGIIAGVDEPVFHAGLRSGAVHPVGFPNLFSGGDVDAGEQALTGAVVRALPDRHIDAAVGHRGDGDDFAGAFGGAFVVPGIGLRAVGFGVAVVFPAELQRAGFFEGFEGVEEAIAPAEQHEGFAVHRGGDRRRPVAVERALADPFLLGCRQLAAFFIEHDQRRGLGVDDVAVLGVLPVGGAGVEEVADEQRGAAADIVRNHLEFLHEVVGPDQVAVGGLERVVGREFHIGGLVPERAIVAIGLPLPVKAEDVAARPDDIEPLVVERRAGADAAFPAVVVRGGNIALHAPGNHHLPSQLSRPGVAALQDSAAGGLLGVFQVLVVDAEEELPVVQRGDGVLVRCQFQFPQQVFLSEGFRQSRLCRGRHGDEARGAKQRQGN